jgi:N utilization substance protein B
MSKTGARSTAREAALQMLYAIEAAEEPKEHVLSQFWRQTPGDPEGRQYAERLVFGITEELAQVDGLISEASQNWRVERMSRVDRNVLRIGTFELLQSQDTPAAVILDEAIELAKRFGSEDSGKFVNGVLERIKTNVLAKDRQTEDRQTEDGQTEDGPAEDGRAEDEA